MWCKFLENIEALVLILNKNQINWAVCKLVKLVINICFDHFLSTQSYHFCTVPLNSPAMNCKVGAQDFTSFIACHCRQLRAANAHNNAKIGSYYDKRKPQGPSINYVFFHFWWGKGTKRRGKNWWRINVNTTSTSNNLNTNIWHSTFCQFLKILKSCYWLSQQTSTATNVAHNRFVVFIFFAI